MPVFPASILILTVLAVSTILRYAIAVCLKIASAGIVKDYSHQPTVSILLPCFNEGMRVYETVESISRSDYPNDKFEIIARDDCSVDDSFEWLVKAQDAFTNIHVSVKKNAHNLGKVSTVMTALKESSADIVIIIDSDCIFAGDALKELVACFADPRIGGVGGVIGVRNVNENNLTRVQTFVYYMCFNILKSLENWSRTITCISGCMFAIRRDLMVKVSPIVMNRNWFGIPINDGEDRFLTHQILLQGYGTVLNTAAKCWTTVPNNFKTLFNQQIRWQRSGIRDCFYTIRRLPRHVFGLHLNAVFSQVVSTIVALTVLLIGSIARGPAVIFFVAPAALGLCAMTAAGFHLMSRKFDPMERVDFPVLLLLYPFWAIAARIIELISLATLDSRDWGTRSKDEPDEPQQVEEQRPGAPAPAIPIPALSLQLRPLISESASANSTLSMLAMKSGGD